MNNREMFETSQDIQNENDVINQVASHWGWVPRKLPVASYKIDWGLFRNGSIFARAMAWAEVKCRTRFHDPFIFALHKYERMCVIAAISGLKSYIIVRWNDRDGIYYVDARRGNHDGVVWFEDPRDYESADKEPCVQINFERFLPLHHPGP